MNTTIKSIALTSIFVASPTVIFAESNQPSNVEQTAPSKKRLIQVTSDNVIQAETTQQFKDVLSRVKINEFEHKAAVASKDNQTVIRSNNDTIYSFAVVDASKGVKVTSAKYDGYQSVYVLDINHSQVALISEGGKVVNVTKDMLTDGDHVYVVVRTGINKVDGKLDIDSAKKAQRDVVVEAKSANPFIGKNYDLESLKVITAKYGKMYKETPFKFPADQGFGVKGKRDEEITKVVSVIGWGGLPSSEAIYASFSGTGDRKVITAAKPKLDYDNGGFVSYTIYDTDGWIASDGFSMNSNTMKENADGTYTITFLADGMEPKNDDKNVIRVPKGRAWTGVVRAYRPLDEAQTNIEMKKLSKAWTKTLN